MQKIISYAFYFLTFTIPLIFTTINNELFEFPKFIILISGTLIIGITWLFDAYKKEDWQLPTSPFNIPILAFLGSQTLSTIFSIHHHTSFWGYYTRFHQGLLTTICYTILYFAYLKYMNKKNTQNIIKISLATSFAIGVYALLQRLGIDKNLWVQDVVNRPFSTLGQPNWMAAYILPNIFLGYYYHLKNKKTNPILLYLLHGVLFATLIISKSRSGYLAFTIGSVILWGSIILKNKLNFRKPKELLELLQSNKNKPILYTLTLYFLIVLLAGTVWTKPVYEYFTNNPDAAITTTTSSGTQLETGGTESGDIRKIVWNGAIELIKQKPILGTGVETFAYSYYWTRPIDHNYVSEWDFIYNKAHNEYLNLAATSGILGLITNLALYAYLAKYTLQKFRKSKQLNTNLLLTLVVSASLATIIVTNFFGFSVIPIAYLIYLLPAMLFTLSVKPEPTEPETINWTHLTTIVISLILPYQLFTADISYNKGKQLNNTGNYSQALPYLENAIQKRPLQALYHSTYSEALSNLAVLAAQTESTQAQSPKIELLATQAAQKTKQLNKWHLNLSKSRAKVYLTLAQIKPDYNQNAAQEIKEARELAPTDPKLAYNLGLIYSRLGDNEKAIQEMQFAINLKNNYEQPYYALTLLYEETKQTDLIPDLLIQAQKNLPATSEKLQNKIDKYIQG